MKTESFLKEIKEKFGDSIISLDKIKDKRVVVKIAKDSLLPVSTYLFKDIGFRYIISSAMDSEEGYEIIYHFSCDKTGLIVNLDVIIPKDKPEIESLVSVIKGTEWIEREIYEILGINFLNHPNLVKFLLPEDWPEGDYPMRRNSNA